MLCACCVACCIACVRSLAGWLEQGIPSLGSEVALPLELLHVGPRQELHSVQIPDEVVKERRSVLVVRRHDHDETRAFLEKAHPSFLACSMSCTNSLPSVSLNLSQSSLDLSNTEAFLPFPVSVATSEPSPVRGLSTTKPTTTTRRRRSERFGRTLAMTLGA